jgi:tetratricopeptide (TPR) repeat protein
MEDAALVRVSLDTDSYDDAFRERVRKELEYRGLTIESFADHVFVREPDGDLSCSIPEALEAFDRLQLWIPVEWTNALDSRVTVQRDTSWWLIHRHDETGYIATARFVETEARSALEHFLNLKPADWTNAFDLGSWPVVDATSSNRFAQRVTREFADRDLDHIVIVRYDASETPNYELRVEKQDTREAETLLSEFYGKIDSLQSHAESLADTDNRQEELETYNILTDLLPGKPAVFYNQASVLYELDRFEESVTGFLEALALGMPQQSLSQYKGNSTGLFQVISQTSRNASSPDYFEDVEAYLKKIEAKLPENIPLLHGLATLARLKNEPGRSLSYYTRILGTDPDNQIARTNQALLLAEEEST